MNEYSNQENLTAIQDLNFEANLPLGILAGGVAMLISASVWGISTYFLEDQISWMAILLGLLVGLAVRKLGRGNSQAFGFSAAGLSLLGCLLGNFYYYVGYISRLENVAISDVILFYVQSPTSILELFALAFQFRDLIINALAVYVGYRVAVGEQG